MKGQGEGYEGAALSSSVVFIPRATTIACPGGTVGTT